MDRKLFSTFHELFDEFPNESPLFANDVSRQVESTVYTPASQTLEKTNTETTNKPNIIKNVSFLESGKTDERIISSENRFFSTLSDADKLRESQSSKPSPTTSKLSEQLRDLTSTNITTLPSNQIKPSINQQYRPSVDQNLISPFVQSPSDSPSSSHIGEQSSRSTNLGPSTKKSDIVSGCSRSQAFQKIQKNVNFLSPTIPSSSPKASNQVINSLKSKQKANPKKLYALSSDAVNVPPINRPSIPEKCPSHLSQSSHAMTNISNSKRKSSGKCDYSGSDSGGSVQITSHSKDPRNYTDRKPNSSIRHPPSNESSKILPRVSNSTENSLSDEKQISDEPSTASIIEITNLRTQITVERETYKYYSNKASESSKKLEKLSMQLEQLTSDLLSTSQLTDRVSPVHHSIADETKSQPLIQVAPNNMIPTIPERSFNSSKSKLNPDYQRDENRFMEDVVFDDTVLPLESLPTKYMTKERYKSSVQATNGSDASEPLCRELPKKKPRISSILHVAINTQNSQRINEVALDQYRSLEHAPEFTNVHVNVTKGFFTRKPRSILLHPDSSSPLSGIIITSSLDGSIQFTDKGDSRRSPEMVSHIKARDTQNGWPEEMCYIGSDVIAVAAAERDKLDSHSKVRSIKMHQVMLIHDLERVGNTGESHVKCSLTHTEPLPHVKGINSMCAMPSYNHALRLATGGKDKRVFLWDFVNDGEGYICPSPRILHWKHTSAVTGILNCKFNNIMYSVGSDNRLIGWSIEQESLVDITKYDDRIHSLHHVPQSPSLLLLSCASTEFQFQVYDARTKRIVLKFGKKMLDAYSSYSSPFLHPNGFICAMGQPKDTTVENNTVMLWDMRSISDQPIQNIRMHDKRVLRGVFDYDGQSMATISIDNGFGLTRFNSPQSVF